MLGPVLKSLAGVAWVGLECSLRSTGSGLNLPAALDRIVVGRSRHLKSEIDCIGVQRFEAASAAVPVVACSRHFAEDMIVESPGNTCLGSAIASVWHGHPDSRRLDRLRNRPAVVQRSFVQVMSR